MDIHLFKGDGTKQDMIDKHKLHVSTYKSLISNSSNVKYAMERGNFNIEDFMVEVTSGACDLQVCRLGTALETYALIEQELLSVGCPHWTDRARESKKHPKRITVYNFGFDKGPDNLGNVPRIRQDRLKKTSNHI